MTNDKRRRAPFGHLEAAFGVTLEPELLERALTHRSFAYENGGLPTNERLEFLGDSVLGVVITDALYHDHPDLPEGQLAKLRASVVNCAPSPTWRGAWARTGSARTCCWARARRPPAAGTRRASSPTRWRRCSARSTCSTAWTRRRGDPPAVRPADGRVRAAGAPALDWKTSLQELTAGCGLGVPEYRIEETGPDHAEDVHRLGGGGRRAVRRRGGPDQEGGRAAGGRGRRVPGADRAAATGAGHADGAEAGAGVPELPEVETVRQGLAHWVIGRTIATVEVRHPRAVRRHAPGGGDFAACWPGGPSPTSGGAASTCGCRWTAATRSSATWACPASCCCQPVGAADEPHLRIRFTFADGGPQLRFVDQRTFGGLACLAGGAELPAEIAHIARDPLDPAFSDAGVRGRAAPPAYRGQAGPARPDPDLRRRQHLRRRGAVAGQAARRAPGRRADQARPRGGCSATSGTCSARRSRQGGTSFDALYVNVNGESGYFDRSLNAYGREGEPCRRCGAPIRREPFMNRSSYCCPRCQPRPRGALRG